MSQQILEQGTVQSDLSAWISQVIGSHTLSPMPGDAGNRRYSRLYAKSEMTYILVEHVDESLDLFLSVQAPFKLHQLPVPEVLAVHPNHRVAILEDLGQVVYLDVLSIDTADLLYKKALSALVPLHQVNPLISGTVLPVMNAEFLWGQYQVFEDWYVKRHLNLELDSEIRNTYSHLVSFIEALPKVVSHMDFHSRNILCRDLKLSGIVDFQDAMFAPITYDVASLLKDCYITWPRYQVLDWLLRFRDELLKAKIIDISFLDKDWVQAFDWVGLQRHIKVLGVFARLNYRDGKSRYLKDIPRILDYILEVSSMYKELHVLQAWFENRVLTCV
ncbi:MAG: aminoglycoside phosphotransferase family protein [Gammaproteobacteria bacterium]